MQMLGVFRGLVRELSSSRHRPVKVAGSGPSPISRQIPSHGRRICARPHMLDIDDALCGCERALPCQQLPDLLVS